MRPPLRRARGGPLALPRERHREPLYASSPDGATVAAAQHRIGTNTSQTCHKRVLFRCRHPRDHAPMSRESRVSHEWLTKSTLRCVRLASRQWRILDVDDLHECGLYARGGPRARRNGRLHPLYRGVYAWGDPHLSLEACFLAAVKACGKDAVLSHFSAAALWRLLEWDYRDPEVTAPTLRKHAGIHTHREPEHRRTFQNGIPVTPPLRTLIDLSSMLPFKLLRRAVNEALNQRLVKPHQLVTRNHRGAQQAPHELSRPEPPRATSSKTSSTPSSRTSRSHSSTRPSLGYVPDFLWPDHGLILEADGRDTHDQLLARADDKARQRVLRSPRLPRPARHLAPGNDGAGQAPDTPTGRAR